MPTVVTPFNIQELKGMVNNGASIWPGANYIIRSDLSRVDLRYSKGINDRVLEYGWVVERHLRDDDIILLSHLHLLLNSKKSAKNLEIEKNLDSTTKNLEIESNSNFQ